MYRDITRPDPARSLFQPRTEIYYRLSPEEQDWYSSALLQLRLRRTYSALWGTTLSMLIAICIGLASTMTPYSTWAIIVLLCFFVANMIRMRDELTSETFRVADAIHDAARKRAEKRKR